MPGLCLEGLSTLHLTESVAVLNDSYCGNLWAYPQREMEAAIKKLKVGKAPAWCYWHTSRKAEI